MNKLIPALLLALCLPAAPALAEQDDGPKPPRAEHMARMLNLSADQQAKVRAILDAEHAKRRALRDETRAQLKGVLTPDQFAKLGERPRQR